MKNPKLIKLIKNKPETKVLVFFQYNLKDIKINCYALNKFFVEVIYDGEQNVIKYLGVINTNIVLGTNIFSDIGASFTDFFGGTSSTYQKKRQSIYDTSIKTLKVKAKNIGANAILSLSIDFDEISGGNKSMFMISVSGTAVIINYGTTKTKNIDFNSKESISIDLLENKLTKN